MYSVINANVATAASQSSEVDLGSADQWNVISLEIPTFSVYLLTAAASLSLLAAVTASADGGTYRPLYDITTSGSTFIPVLWNVPAGNGNQILNIPPALGVRYLKVDIGGNTSTASFNFKVICR
ncbi:MAG TPA: hypothetical protein P5110_07590 [Candidatus Omnitrophota bacterium]|nr:hypothetical protein [Candidatus Omnitrophota bacterium]